MEVIVERLVSASAVVTLLEAASDALDKGEAGAARVLLEQAVDMAKTTELRPVQCVEDARTQGFAVGNLERDTWLAEITSADTYAVQIASLIGQFGEINPDWVKHAIDSMAREIRAIERGQGDPSTAATLSHPVGPLRMTTAKTASMTLPAQGSIGRTVAMNAPKQKGGVQTTWGVIIALAVCSFGAGAATVVLIWLLSSLF